MRVLLTAALCAAGALATNLTSAQGPVREGLRRTGEAVIGGARTVVQGVGEAAENVAEGTIGGAARAFDRSPQARWRFTRHNGRWWYYTPQNQWMYHRDGQWQAHTGPAAQSNATIGPDSQQQLAQSDQSGQRRYSAGYRSVETPVEGTIDASADQTVGVEQPLQPIPQQSQAAYQPAPAYAAPAAGYGARRYSYGGDDGRIWAGGWNVDSRYERGVNAPREINNNPRSATWGAIPR